MFLAAIPNVARNLRCISFLASFPLNSVAPLTQLNLLVVFVRFTKFVVFAVKINWCKVARSSYKLRHESVFTHSNQIQNDQITNHSYKNQDAPWLPSSNELGSLSQSFWPATIAITAFMIVYCCKVHQIQTTATDLK